MEEESQAQPAPEEPAEEAEIEPSSMFKDAHHQQLAAAIEKYGEEKVVNARSQLEINKFHITGHAVDEVAQIIDFLEQE